MKQNRCCICNAEIADIHYFIRDMKRDDTYFRWIWRHIVSILAFRIGRKYAVILPVCDNCVNMRLDYNAANDPKKLV